LKGNKLSTQTLYLEGLAKWAMVYPGQEDTKYGKKCKIDLYFTDESLQSFKLSGSRKKLRSDDQGIYTTFTRSIDEINPQTEEPYGYPKVVSGEGADIKPFDKIIGNGSKVVLKVVVYDSKFGRGTRLEGVRVLEHVPYEAAQEDDSPYAF
jgi:hypothetical protein